MNYQNNDRPLDGMEWASIIIAILLLIAAGGVL